MQARCWPPRVRASCGRTASVGGGSWNNNRNNARAAYRNNNNPNNRKIDHAILTNMLARVIREDDVMSLAETIVASGEGVLDDEYLMVWFRGDDLLAACRPRGLPIGNLTSQF